MLSHRERVFLALEHQAPDRVPVDLGGTQTSILVEPYNCLKRCLGLDTMTRVQNMVMGLAQVEPVVLEMLGIDLRHVWPRMPDTWRLEILPDDSFYDDWGVRWHRPPGGYYYDMVEHPLAAVTLDAVEQYAWPDPLNPGRIAGARSEAQALYAAGEYAIEAGLVGLWESAWFAVGFERWLLACRGNVAFVEAVLAKTLDVLVAQHTNYLEQVGPFLDMVTLWDDYGVQSSTLVSPADWRRLVKPGLAKLVAAIRSMTQAKIGIHSCGDISRLLDDLVEVGIQVINPVQVSAKGMQPAALKQRYGKELVFWGGIDTQQLLPYGSPLDVAQAVREAVATLGRDGGYILAAVHNIQPGVPPENILAMYTTAME